MRRTLLLCIVATALAKQDDPAADAPADAAPADAAAPAPAPADGAAAAAPAPKAGGSRFTRPGKYPLNPAGLALKPEGMPDGVLGDDIDSVGRQLKVSIDALRRGAGAQPMPDMTPRNTYLNTLLYPSQTAMMAGLQNPLSNPYTNPLMKIAMPAVMDPFNPWHLFSPQFLGLRSPRITQHSQAIPPLPYPFANEP